VRITPDGKSILAVIRPFAGFPGHNEQRLVMFSARTGKPVRVLNDLHFLGPENELVQWSSPSGNKLIITGARPGRDPLGATVLAENAGVLSGRRYTPLPWSSRIFTAAW
jgi:hypothetical protein